ncbi:MAG: VOC family protein [Acidobacteriaceae bacterium]
MRNRSVPVDTVLPHLVYHDVLSARDWLTRVFGLTESYRYGDPVSGIQMRIGTAYVMLQGPKQGFMSPAQLGYRTQSLSIFLRDVQAHYDRTKATGANILEELHETVYGERQYVARDLEGHHWLFSQHVHNVDPADWGAIVTSPW